MAPKIPTAKPANPSSPLWEKLAPYDKNQDGKLSLGESMDVFESQGLPKGWSFVSAFTTAIARGPIGLGEVNLYDVTHPSELVSVDLDHIHKTILKGQSGVWDTSNGNADPAKAAAFIAEVDGNDGASDGHITLDGIRQRVERDVSKSVDGLGEPMKTFERKKRFGESFSAWVVLMELAGQPDANGQRYLTPDQVKSVFDGTLFDMIQRDHHGQVSVPRMAIELALKTLEA
jgi:hypothetical protein